jgi:hypothetical protein
VRRLAGKLVQIVRAHEASERVGGWMLRVTPEAARWIAQLLDDVTGRRPSEDVLRLSCHGDGEVTFTRGRVGPNDLLCRSGDRVVLAVDARLAAQLSESTIERDVSERGAGVVVTRSTAPPSE